MTTANSTKLAATIKAKRRALTELQTARNRAHTTAQAGDTHAAELAKLTQQRQDIVGQAFIVHSAADTTAIDEAIKAAIKGSSESQESTEAARCALPLLDTQIAAAQAELAHLQLDHGRAVLADLRSEFAERLQSLLTDGDKLMAAFAELDGLASVINIVSERVTSTPAVERSKASWIAGVLAVPRMGDGSTPWFTTTGRDAAGVHAPAFARALCEQLAGEGFDVAGAPMRPARTATPPAEPRPVTVTTAGKVQIARTDEDHMGMVSSVVR